MTFLRQFPASLCHDFKRRSFSFTLETAPYKRACTSRSIGSARQIVVTRRTAHGWTANIRIDQTTLLTLLSSFLDPFAPVGADGTILLAFILGIPANEIVIPVMIMAHTAQSSLVDFQSLSSLHTLLTEQGWTFSTAVHADFFCPALALRYHTFNHKKRNPQPENDSACLFAAHLHGVSALFSCHLFFSQFLLSTLILREESQTKGWQLAAALVLVCVGICLVNKPPKKGKVSEKNR